MYCQNDLPGSKRTSPEHSHGICQTCLYEKGKTCLIHAKVYLKLYGEHPPVRVRTRFKSKTTKQVQLHQEIPTIRTNRYKQKRAVRLVLSTTVTT